MSVRLPALRALQAFEATGRFGSVTAAARDLGVSPGAVSQQIHRLEKEVGIPLFERHGRSLTLTPWGRIYLDRISVGFERLRAAEEVLQRARLKSTVVLSAPPSLVACWLGPILTNWRNVSPETSIRVIGEDAEPDFDDSMVDFRISYGVARLRYAHFTDLFQDWVVPACSPAFLEHIEITGAADIIAQPLIGIEWENPYQSPPSWSEWAARYGQSKPPLPFGLSFSLSSAAIDAARNDNGFVLGQWSMISNDVKSRKLVVPCDCPMELAEPYALAFNVSSLNRPQCREFRTYLVKAGKKLMSAALSSQIRADVSGRQA